MVDTMRLSVYSEGRIAILGFPLVKPCKEAPCRQKLLSSTLTKNIFL